LFHHDVTGVGFELPASWRTTDSGPVLVFSGPPKTDSYFTTITYQAVPQEEDLEAALLRAHARIATLPRFAWHLRDPIALGTRPALRYGFQVELHESLRWKHGVLFPASGTLVNLTYSATPDLFAGGISVFEQVLATLAVVDTTR
jgi:hypothetical protein